MDVIELPHGETVTQDGIYATPLNWYHSQGICDGPSVSSSMLRSMWRDPAFGICPADLWDNEPNFNPSAPKRETKNHFSLGSAVHALVMGDEDFEKEYVVRPNKQGVVTMVDAKAKLKEEGVTFKSSHTKAELFDLLRTQCPEAVIWDDLVAAFDLRTYGRTQLTMEQGETALRMAETVRNHPIVRAGLLSGYVEKSFIWKDKETGLWIKSRIDVMPDLGSISDLKTTAAQVPSKRAYAIRDYRYDIQLAMGRMAARELLGVDVTTASLLYVGSTYPYRVTHHPVGLFTLNYGEKMAQKAIRATAHGLETGEWPEYSHDSEFNITEYTAACIDAVE